MDGPGLWYILLCPFKVSLVCACRRPPEPSVPRIGGGVLEGTQRSLAFFAPLACFRLFVLCSEPVLAIRSANQQENEQVVELEVVVRRPLNVKG